MRIGAPGRGLYGERRVTVYGMGDGGKEAGKDSDGRGVGHDGAMQHDSVAEALWKPEPDAPGHAGIREKKRTGERMEGRNGYHVRPCAEVAGAGGEVECAFQYAFKTGATDEPADLRYALDTVGSDLCSDERDWRGVSVWHGGAGAGLCDYAAANGVSGRGGDAPVG